MSLFGYLKWRTRSGDKEYARYSKRNMKYMTKLSADLNHVCLPSSGIRSVWNNQYYKGVPRSKRVPLWK